MKYSIIIVIIVLLNSCKAKEFVINREKYSIGKIDSKNIVLQKFEVTKELVYSELLKRNKNDTTINLGNDLVVNVNFSDKKVKFKRIDKPVIIPIDSVPIVKEVIDKTASKRIEKVLKEDKNQKFKYFGLVLISLIVIYKVFKVKKA